jgi:tetratricopeptide (TPR) repeat protein
MVYFLCTFRGIFVGGTLRFRMKLAALPLGIVLLAAVAGCSSGAGTTVVGGADRSVAVLPDTTDPRALWHFVDGTTCELRGEHAGAVLEYQDALRYSRSAAIYFALSRNYSYLGKHSLAIEAGREAVRLSPGNLEYRRALADGLFTAFQLDSAAYQYEQIIARDSSDVSAWYNLGRIYETRRPLRAIEIYEQLLARFGPEWNVLLQVTELYNKQGQFDKAAAALLQMREIDPGNQALLRTLAQTYVKAEKYDEALKAYSTLLEMDSRNLEYLADVGSVYLLKRDYQTAARYFTPILTADSVALDAKVRIGQLYYEQVEKDSSLIPLTRSIFDSIRVDSPGDWRPYWFLGALASMTHDDSASARNFRRVTELAGWNPDGWVGLALGYFGKNDFSEAARILEAGQKQVPKDFRLNFFLGVAYNRIGQTSEAASSLERALQINPDDFDATAELAMVYDGLKRHEESDSLYERAIRMDSPQRHLALNNYAYALAERNLQLERALQMVKEALKSQPNNDSYLDTIGWVYYRLEDYAQAEEYLLQAIQAAKAKGEPSATLYEHLGDVYSRMNAPARAVEYWKKALAVSPGNTVLQEKISRGSL